MPATNPESSGARKRTLSTKAATNGDPNAERKRQKLEDLQKKATKTAHTKKAPTPLASKKKAAARKTPKKVPRHPSVDSEEASDKADQTTTNGSDDGIYEEAEPGPEVIVIDDGEETAEVDIPEPPEESAESELRMYLLFFLLDELTMI
jgi:hypothetical protein